MATGSPNREFSTEELDAMAAAELPVENPETSRTASAPVASAPTAPEATGSPELAVGDGTSFSMQEPPRGPAMGPVAKLEAGREYSTEELDLIEQANKPKEFTSDELDKATVDALNDPKYIPTRDEYFDQKATKERMVAAGKLPGTAEVAAKAVGGLFVSAGDAFNMAVAHPLETIARSPATLQTGVGRATIGALQLGGWAKQALEGDPKYRDEATGEFFTFSDPDFLRQQMEQGKKLRPTNEEDLKDWEFQNHIYKKGIDSEYQDLGQKAGPTELITRVLTGRNQNELPIESQSQVVEMASDPTNLIPFGAGAKALGLSRGMKLVSSQAAGVVEKLSGGLVKGNDVLAERFAKVVTNTTGLAPEDLTTIGKALNYSKNVGIGAGIAGGAAAVGAPPEVAQFIAGFYPAYKAGLGVLRKIETGAGTAKIIMREAADATNGLDQAARAAVLANNSVPQVFKEVLERPSQFVSIESTPARLAANQSLSPQMRAFMGKLSNPAIVQAVRGSSALAKGAVKGVAINAPFAALAYNAGEDDQAAGMLGAGVAFGAAGAGIDRFTGLQERRQQAAISDVSRMLVDVELNAGDVSKLMSTQTPDNLVKLAAMQGTFRNGLDFVPLNAIDYEKNVSSNGGAGAAGLFLQAVPGERARIYINLDAKRQGIEPHEFGHALLASGALDGQQKYAARAWVEKAYGADGIKSRASEYASAIIRAKNSEAFPDGNFEISPGTLASEMDNLTQGGLARGDMDGLDWARDEIFAETFAQASQSMDFSAIRRGAPAGGNVLTFAEGILGAQSRALSASGVRIDPQTGAPLDTPDALFKENPLLATDKNLINQLGTYINNYRQWANDPTHEKPRPNKVAPSGRASDVINNPQVTFYDRGDGVKATTFAVQDPVTGQAVLRDQRDLNAEHKKVREQLKALAGSRLLPDKDPVLGPKKTTDGRVTVRGRVLPQSFDFLNGFMPHIRNFARQFEALGAAGESMQVRYHAIGSGDSGAFQIKKLGNLEAITREVVPWGWELTKAGNLNATVLDLSQFRNRAMRAINDHNPALAVFEWDMGKIEGDLKQWMQNHRDELPGNTKIGDLKRDVLNSLVGVATTENRSRNPLHGSFGPGSAIKQFRLDRVDAAVGTGRQGFHFDYEKAKGNFMPDKPAPMPDLSRDLPTDKGQAMPDAGADAVPDKGIEMPAGSMTQLFTTAAKSLPKTIPQAKSVPSVRVMIREKLFDDEGKPVLDKNGNQKEGMTPKLRDNTEVKFQPGNFDLPLPNYQLAKSKFSLGNKNFISEAAKNRAKVVAAIEQVNKATEVITNDPFKFTDPKGYAEIMRDAGVTKNILVPPSGIDMMLKRPKDFIALLDGGFHGPRTVSGTREAAMSGLDSVVEMRKVIGEKPTEFVTALHHLWGTLSKQLPPLDQEALWMRLVVNPEVIEQIQNSINGTFKLKKEQWKTIVNKARTATKGEYGKLGNNATSNANSFYLMLKNHNGRWNQVSDLYATDSAIDMRSKFNSLGHGATGIKNKVQGFIGLTFGIKGTVLDRWRFVDLYMDPVMQATGAPTHQHYFQYTGDAKRIPQDPIGIYANYGTIENDNPAFSLALYNGIDRAAQAAINASPELKAYLGNHADPGGLHWVTWNAIKNEAVGHSSLDLTKNFLKEFEGKGTSSDWVSFVNKSKAHVEGQAANGREIIRLSLDNGVFNYSRQ